MCCADQFDTVDTAFSLDVGCEKGMEAHCDDIKRVTNLVIVIGERASNQSKGGYGYIAYKLNEEHTYEDLPKDFAPFWGLTFTGGELSEPFWPQLSQNKSIYVGSVYGKNQKVLFLMINQMDAKTTSPVYQIYARRLESSGDKWSEYKVTDSEKMSGFFTINGDVYSIDPEFNILSIKANDDLTIEKTVVVSNR